MFKARRLSSMVGLFVVAFVFALALTMTMVSTTYSCGAGGICKKHFDVCPEGCAGGPCVGVYPQGGEGPCCGELMFYVCEVER